MRIGIKALIGVALVGVAAVVVVILSTRGASDPGRAAADCLGAGASYTVVTLPRTRISIPDFDATVQGRPVHVLDLANETVADKVYAASLTEARYRGLDPRREGHGGRFTWTWRNGPPTTAQQLAVLRCVD
jgi:hypothetical protein